MSVQEGGLDGPSRSLQAGAQLRHWSLPAPRQMVRGLRVLAGVSLLMAMKACFTYPSAVSPATQPPCLLAIPVCLPPARVLPGYFGGWSSHCPRPPSSDPPAGNTGASGGRSLPPGLFPASSKQPVLFCLPQAKRCGVTGH